MPFLIIFLTVVALFGVIMYTQHQTSTMEQHWQRHSRNWSMIPLCGPVKVMRRLSVRVCISMIVE